MKRSGITTLACLIIILLYSGMLPSSTQAIGTPEPKSSVITAQNIKQVKELARLGKGGFQDSAWSPDGKQYVIASTLGIWLYDATQLKAEPRFIATPSGCSALAISPDGETLACGGQDGAIIVWDRPHETQTTVLRGHAQAIFSLAFSPDGRLLASGDMGGMIQLWDATTFATLATLDNGNDQAATDLKFSSDNKVLAVNGDTLWDVATQTPFLKIPFARAIAFSAEAGVFATGNDDVSISLWKSQQVTSVFHVQTRLQETPYYFLAFTPDGNALISNAWEDTIHIWDVNAQTQLQEFGTPTDPLSALSLSPDGSTLVVSAADGVLRVMDLATNAVTASLTGFTGLISSLALHPNQSTVATGEYNILRLWDISTHIELRRILDNRDVVRGVAFSPDGTLLASSSQDAQTILWNVADWQRLKTLPHERGNMETALTFSPDGTLLASASLDENVRLWDAKTGELVTVLTGHTGHSVGVAFTPDGSMLASGSFDGRVRLWDIKTHQITSTFSTTENDKWGVIIADIAFNADASIIAATTWDGDVYVWDVSSEKLLAKLAGNTVQTSPLAFSPDGSLLVFGSADYSLSVYEMQSREKIDALIGHTGFITGVLFNRDGTQIITSSHDGTLRIWGLQP